MQNNPITSNLLKQWVTKHLQQAELEWQTLKAEASHRHFFRLISLQKSWVLMVSPPEFERNDYFVGLAEFFSSQAIPVPRILHSHLDQGWFLLEDLGTVHLQDLYGKPSQTAALVAAIGQLVHLQSLTHPLIEPYTETRFNDELDIYEHWFASELLNQPVELAQRNQLIDAISAQPTGCVHRDYHCRNLLFQNHQLGIVDFQDALHGPILYDPASLLRDCYHVFDEPTVTHYLQRYVEQTQALESIRFEQIQIWFDYTAIQRQLKAVGIFARLYLRDNKQSHLEHIVPVMIQLQALTARYPSAAHST